jgi:NAD-dependent deacetylase
MFWLFYICQMKRLVVLSGAGISAESGLKTFRDSGGLWEGYAIEEVATPEAFNRYPERVLRFYNERRRQLDSVKPNKAHELLAKLEKHFNTTIITQNVDDLHEQAGSAQVLHLHGELRWACSSAQRERRVYLGAQDIQLGQLHEDGSYLRPDIVWFGEAVPMMDMAIPKVMEADILVVVGTSLEVYPAASLLQFAPSNAAIYIIDPYRHGSMGNPQINVISKTATEGMQELFCNLVPDEMD